MDVGAQAAVSTKIALLIALPSANAKGAFCLLFWLLKKDNWTPLTFLISELIYQVLTQHIFWSPTDEAYNYWC